MADGALALDGSRLEDRASLDGTADSGAEPLPPSAGCACSAPARTSRRAVTPGAMIALSALLLRRKRRRRAN